MSKLTIGVIAIRTARLRSKANRPTSAVGYCLREVRECFRVDSRYPSAGVAWEEAVHKHPVRGDVAAFIRSIPRGVPVFWVNGDGHVAISTGFRGRCYSTDIRRDGYFDKVDIAYITQKWPHLRLVGWAEDINGVRVYPDKAS